MLIIYKSVARWIIALLAALAITVIILLRCGKWDVKLKDMAISILGITLFIAMYNGAARAVYLLLVRFWSVAVFNHNLRILTTIAILAVFLPYVFYYSMGLIRVASRDTIRLSAAVIFTAMGIIMAVLMPGFAYLPLISAILVVLQIGQSRNRVLFYVTFAIAIVLFLPALFCETTQMGIASPQTALIYSLFIVLLYVFTKDLPNSY